MIPDLLTEAAEYLRGENLNLVQTGSGPRTDSAESERQVIQALQNANRWHVHSPNIGSRDNRGWYDVQIGGYYCDIKISTCSRNDNASAKKAIYYLLTGDEQAGRVPNNSSAFFRRMREQEAPDENRDFYYLVVNKRERGDVFFVSLKGMAHCAASSRNPPFQANWGRNREPVERTWEEAKQHLLGVWAESIRRLISLEQGGMPPNYPEFFRGE